MKDDLLFYLINGKENSFSAHRRLLDVYNQNVKHLKIAYNSLGNIILRQILEKCLPDLGIGRIFILICINDFLQYKQKVESIKNETFSI